MEAFHSKFRKMRSKEYPRRLDSFGHMMSSERNGITPRVISEDFCITKLFDSQRVKTFPSYASVQLFRYALKSLWIPRYFPPESKAASLEMWSTIKADLEKVFKETTWMDDKSKKRMIDKLQAIQFQGGYPDEMLKKDKMQSYHNKFFVDSLEANSFVENLVNLFLVPQGALK